MERIIKSQRILCSTVAWMAWRWKSSTWNNIASFECGLNMFCMTCSSDCFRRSEISESRNIYQETFWSESWGAFWRLDLPHSGLNEWSNLKHIKCENTAKPRCCPMHILESNAACRSRPGGHCSVVQREPSSFGGIFAGKSPATLVAQRKPRCDLRILYGICV